MEPIVYQFDMTNIDPYVGGSSPLPTGTYPFAITSMQVKPNNKAETGHNLAIEYTVIDGELKGRKLYENLNLWHTGSIQAVEIATKQLSSIAHAVGILVGADLTVLAHKPMFIEIELQDATPDTPNPNTGEMIRGRGPQNRIVRRDAYAPGASGVQFNQQAQSQAAGAAPPFNPAQGQSLSKPGQAQAPTASAQTQFVPQVGQQTPAQQVGQQAQNQQAAAPVNSAVPPWQK